MEVKKCVPRQVSFTIGKAGRLGKTFGKVFYWDDLAKVRGPNTSWKWPKLRVRLFEVMNDRAIPFPVTMTTGNITYIPGDLNEASHPRLRTSQMFVFFQFFDSIFFEGSSTSVSWNPNKNVFFKCQKETTVRLHVWRFLKSISTNPQRIFEPTQALNLFASIQRNAPQWVRKLQNLCCGYSCQYNSKSFTSLKFMQHTKFMQHVKRSLFFPNHLPSILEKWRSGGSKPF